MALATVSSVAGSATAVTLFAARSGVSDGGVRMIYNDSTATLYVKFGASASTTDFTVKILGDGYYEVPQPAYDGLITGIWSSATGSARCTTVSV